MMPYSLSLSAHAKFLLAAGADLDLKGGEGTPQELAEKQAELGSFHQPNSQVA